MADYLFWHRANTENSGFFRENRYLDQERERERESQRESQREGEGRGKVRMTISSSKFVSGGEL